MRAMQMINHCSFSPIHLKLIKPPATVLTPLGNFAQIERGNRPLLYANAIGKFCQEDCEIFHIGCHWLPIAACTLRHEGSRHTDHTRNRADHIMAEINTMSTHISDLARSRQ